MSWSRYSCGRDGSTFLPLLWEQHSEALPKRPVKFLPAARRHAEQNQLGNPIRITLCIGEGQRAAPGPTEHQPAINPQMSSEQLDVIDQVAGSVLE